MLKLSLFAAFSIAMTTAVCAEATAMGPVIVSPAGKVLVNQGNGFVAATDGLTLKFNDRIMVGKDGAVTLAFAKCSVVLKQGTLLTLPKGDLCGKTAVASLQSSEVVKVEPVMVSIPRNASEVLGESTPTLPLAKIVPTLFAISLAAYAGYNIATLPTTSKP